MMAKIRKPSRWLFPSLALVSLALALLFLGLAEFLILKCGDNTCHIGKTPLLGSGKFESFPADSSFRVTPTVRGGRQLVINFQTEKTRERNIYMTVSAYPGLTEGKLREFWSRKPYKRTDFAPWIQILIAGILGGLLFPASLLGWAWARFGGKRKPG